MNQHSASMSHNGNNVSYNLSILWFKYNHQKVKVHNSRVVFIIIDCLIAIIYVKSRKTEISYIIRMRILSKWSFTYVFLFKFFGQGN